MKSKFKILKPAKPMNNSWMLSFADFLSLILAFFVLMYATNTIPTETWNLYKNELAKYGSSSHLSMLEYIRNPSEEQSLNEKKIIKTKFQIDYTKNLFLGSLSKLNLSNQEVFLMTQSDEIFIFLKKDVVISENKNRFKLTSKGNDILYSISIVLENLPNQLIIGYPSEDKIKNFKISNFIAEKLKELGYENNVSNFFSFTNSDINYKEYIVLAIKKHEANL